MFPTQGQDVVARLGPENADPALQSVWQRLVDLGQLEF
jgi:hypothetical protein